MDKWQRSRFFMLATCSLDGPERCSGLLIKRRGFESLLTACKNLSTVNIGISADIVSAGVE